MKKLEGRVAIVTGSSSGIGRAIAHCFAEEGARLTLAARRRDLLEETVAQVKARGVEALGVQTDVSDEDQVERLVQRTVDEWGRLDIMINNAGIGGGGPIAQVETAEWDRVINTNLRGTFFCCRAALRRMEKSGGGFIVNISSVAGVQAWAGSGVYSASKFGIMGLTQAIAAEGREHGIRAAAICPGAVAADLVDADVAEIRKTGRIDPRQVAETALFLVTMEPNTVVHQIVLDRLGADW